MTTLLDKLQSASDGNYTLSKLVGDYLGAEERYEHPGSESPSHRCYTTNLQDAVSLVPGGHQWAVGNRNLPIGQFFAEVIRPPQSAFSDQGLGKAPTPALALCIAIIKAHEAKAEAADTYTVAGRTIRRGRQHLIRRIAEADDGALEGDL